MDFKNDLNSIEEIVMRGKSIVQESIDLTKKNAERRKEIQKKLQNCFSATPGDSFALDLEYGRISVGEKEKNEEKIFEEDFKCLNGKIGELEKEKKVVQGKLEEYQEIVKDLESEVFSFKSKIKLLINQLKETEEELKRVNLDVLNLKDQNEQLIVENLEIKVKYEKTLKENGVCKDNYNRLLGEFEMLNGKNLFAREEKGSFSALNKKVVRDRKDFDCESSTESYYQFLNNLKKNGIETSAQEKSSFTPLVEMKGAGQKSEFLAKFKLKNEEIVDRLEEDYKKTDEKFKKISKNIIHNTNSSNKRKNNSFTDICPFLSEPSRPKISVKVKHKRALVRKSSKKKIS